MKLNPYKQIKFFIKDGMLKVRVPDIISNGEVTFEIDEYQLSITIK